MSNIVRTSQPIIEKLVLTDEEISASGVYTSDSIDLTSIVPSSGYFSVQVEVTGDGTCKIEYLLSNDGIDYISPSTATEIATGLTKTTNTSGKDIYSFSPMLSKFMKIAITETGTSDSVTVSLTLLAQ